MSQLGYIVENGRSAMVQVDGILYLAGRTVTVFQTRARARAATQRTARYVEKHGLLWDTDHRIIRLVEEPREQP